MVQISPRVTHDRSARGSIHPRFTVWDVTSGLPDNSREAEELGAKRRPRELRGRVKAARAALSAQPEAQEALRADWRREAAFFARFGITQEQFRHGVPAVVVGTERGGTQGWSSAEVRHERAGAETPDLDRAI
jgi:hypothetical protein